MRRIWYSYLLSVVASKETLKGILLVVCLAAFASLVYVQAVIDNLLAIELSMLPQHLFSVATSLVTEGKLLECLTAAVVAYVLVTFPWPSLRSRGSLQAA